jgi:formylglycine-generating enzyme required for sulfatase activity
MTFGQEFAVIVAEKAGIFISYRRGDGAASAGRLHDRLQQTFGSNRVFMDVERIQSGEDFAQVIDAKLATCEVFIAVIGRNWLRSADQYGRRCLDIPSDWVRMETAAALSGDLLVIPLLVEDAALPPTEALPGDLVRLPDLQAMDIHHASFHQDVDRLIERIEREMTLKRDGRAPASAIAPGTVKVHAKDGCEYAWVPPGTFWMGRAPNDNVCDGRYDDEKPRHHVEISRGFWLGRTPVTVAAFRRFVAARRLEMPRPPKYNPNWSEHEHPIVNVPWGRAREYCAWIGGRLPTEAQWEYAARGGIDGAIYPWGGSIAPDQANYDENKQWQRTSPVGMFAPNRFNVLDMIGNVWEWVADWYDESTYAARSAAKPTLDPQVYQNETDKRVVRGGSWRSIAVEVRTSNRGFQTPNDGFDDFGFRCLVDNIQ